MKKSCLFVINGLGLGNSTRCYAIMECLSGEGIDIDVITSGNGLAFFEDKSCIRSLSAMDSFYYSGSNGGVSGWSTLKSLRSLARIAGAKKRSLADAIGKWRPDLAVVDSEYALAPLRREGVPVIAINTSEMVVSEYLKRRRCAPRNTRSQFWLVEFSDYLFHKHNCDLVLSPFPVPATSRHRKFRRIGLIVRRSVLRLANHSGDKMFPPPRSLRTVLFMLSGSTHATTVDIPDNLPFKVEVVGLPGTSRDGVVYHGRVMNNFEMLARADALVINGGYSAVSEAFALGKPTFVLPVDGHSEQFVNAALVHDLGLGFVTRRDKVISDLMRMHDQNQWIGRKPFRAGFQLDGAAEAAEAILNRLRQSTLPEVALSEPLPAGPGFGHSTNLRR